MLYQKQCLLYSNLLKTTEITKLFTASNNIYMDSLPKVKKTVITYSPSCHPKPGNGNQCGYKTFSKIYFLCSVEE